MRIKGTREKEKIKGYYVRDATMGFFGDKSEGCRLLELMGLQSDSLPFSMAFYLKNHNAQWKDANGNVVSISFRINQQRIDFSASYLGQRKTSTLFREWEEYEDKDDVAHLESEAIGNQSMMCVYDRLLGESTERAKNRKKNLIGHDK